MRALTPAVVLGTIDYGEADRIVTLYTRELGKVAALARGARKSVKRFGAGLGLFGVGEALLHDRPQADLATLERFDGARGFPALLTDVAKMAHGGYACELVRELTPPRQPEPALFELLVTLFAALETSPARSETLRLFELQLLDRLGLRPELERCVACGAPAPERVVLDLRRGGIVCASCPGHGQALAPGVRCSLVAAQQIDLAAAPSFSLPPNLGAACREALAAIIADHVGRPLKSLAFIAKLNHALL